MRQGVTIGNRFDGGEVPIIEDDVEFGAYAQVLGGVRVGKGAKIGAMSVVLCDVPCGATAVGIPARIIQWYASNADNLHMTTEASTNDSSESGISSGEDSLANGRDTVSGTFDQ